MKVGLKGALGLAAAYGVLMAVFALGMERSLRSLEEHLSTDTVRLLAREQANLVVERSLETLRFPDAGSRRRLHQRIQDLTLLSEVVTSLAVVGPDGTVVASEAPGVQARLATAAALFSSPPQARLEPSEPTSFLRGGDYVVLLPLVEGGVLAGYLRVGLHSDHVASLYEEGRSRLVILGFARPRRRRGAWASSCRSSSRGGRPRSQPSSRGRSRRAGPSAPSDEFAHVLLQASRVKGDLDEALRQCERRGLQVGALARRLAGGGGRGWDTISRWTT